MPNSSWSETAPIFVVGASRSGTTMLRLLLNAHPNIGIPNEFSYFTSIPESWLQSWQHVPVSGDEYKRFVRDNLFRKGFLGNVGVDTDALLEHILVAAESRDLSVPYRLMLEAYADAEGKSRWGEKTPTNLFFCDVLYEMFPEAKFIHLVRDPRAVVRSANNFPRLPNDTVINALNWLHFVEKGYQRLIQEVPPEQWCTIRYEELTSDPKLTAREICQFIEEPFEPDMLEFHRDAKSYMPPSIDQLGGDRKVTRPIYSDKQEKWRTELSEHEIGVVEFVCGRGMQEFGYEPTGAQIQWMEVPDFAFKYIYSVLKRWQHRQGRSHVIRYRPLSRFGLLSVS